MNLNARCGSKAYPSLPFSLQTALNQLSANFSMHTPSVKAFCLCSPNNTLIYKLYPYTTMLSYCYSTELTWLGFKILKRSLQLEIILFLHTNNSSLPLETTGSNPNTYFFTSPLSTTTPHLPGYRGVLGPNRFLGHLCFPPCLSNSQLSSFLGP